MFLLGSCVSGWRGVISLDFCISVLQGFYIQPFNCDLRHQSGNVGLTVYEIWQNSILRNTCSVGSLYSQPPWWVCRGFSLWLHVHFVLNKVLSWPFTYVLYEELFLSFYQHFTDLFVFFKLICSSTCIYIYIYI